MKEDKIKKINFAWLLVITPLIPLTIAAKCTTTKPAEPVKPEPNNTEENLKAYEFEFMPIQILIPLKNTILKV